MKYYTSVYPPKPKLDIWATIQNFYNPVEGTIIHCNQPTIDTPSTTKLLQNYPNPSNKISRSHTIYQKKVTSN